MQRELLATLGIVAVMSLGGLTAKADLILTLDDAATGGIEVIVADNVGAGVFLAGSGLTTTHGDGSGEVGLVFFQGSIGVFLGNSVSGVSKPLLGPPGQMNLSAVNASDGPGVMTVSLTDTDFSSALPFDVRNELGGVTDGSVVSEWGADLDNGHFSFASGFGSIGPFGPGAFDENASIGPLGADPSLSLTNAITVTHTSGSLTSLSSNVIIPEPSTALLLVAVVPIVLRRR